MKDLVTLNVDPNMVSSVLEKEIQTAIVSQLGNQDKLIAGLVKQALAEKVSSNGKKGSYESENRYDFLEILASNSIRDAAKSALKEWLEQNSYKVREAVLEELQQPSRQRSIALAYADAIENSLKCNWNMSCNIDFKRNED
jgi:uncharacterized membrane protein YheB (UPF0754 family)